MLLWKSIDQDNRKTRLQIRKSNTSQCRFSSFWRGIVSPPWDEYATTAPWLATKTGISAEETGTTGGGAATKKGEVTSRGQSAKAESNGKVVTRFPAETIRQVELLESWSGTHASVNWVRRNSDHLKVTLAMKVGNLLPNWWNLVILSRRLTKICICAGLLGVIPTLETFHISNSLVCHDNQKEIKIHFKSDKHLTDITNSWRRLVTSRQRRGRR